MAMFGDFCWCVRKVANKTRRSLSRAEKGGGSNGETAVIMDITNTTALDDQRQREQNACTVWYAIEPQTGRLPNALWATAETDGRHHLHASAGSHAQLVERLKERAALCGCTSPTLARDTL